MDKSKKNKSVIIQQSTDSLEKFLRDERVKEISSGNVIEKRMANFGSLIVYIYPEDHPPPHFHVRGPDIDASFRIDDGSLLVGVVSHKDQKKIARWYGGGKEREALEGEWERLNPRVNR